MKRLIAALIAAMGLAGCVAVPYEPGAAYPTPYPAPAYGYYPPAASLSFGYSHYDRGYYGPRYRHWR